MKRVCVEIDGMFYESLSKVYKKTKETIYFVRKKCLSDDYPDYKIVPFRISYTDRKCAICGEIKLLKEFHKQTKGRAGFNSKCKECASKTGKEFRKNNPKKARTYYLKRLEYLKEYRRVHKKEIKKKREKYKEKRNEGERMKRRNDPMCRLNCNISSVMRYSLKNGQKNKKHWEDLVGYTAQDLKIHLEKQFLPGMTWENYGKGDGKWQVDHIILLYWFVFKTPKDKGFKKAWALENLRPMWGRDNQLKNNKLFY